MAKMKHANRVQGRLTCPIEISNLGVRSKPSTFARSNEADKSSTNNNDSSNGTFVGSLNELKFNFKLFKLNQNGVMRYSIGS